MMGLRKAINDKCKDCIYDEYGKGNWRQQVMACTMPKCPLYDVRPISKPKSQKASQIAMPTEDIL